MKQAPRPADGRAAVPGKEGYFHGSHATFTR
jgi:hypothetical protein